MLASAYCFLLLKEKKNDISLEKLSLLLGKEYNKQEAERFLQCMNMKHRSKQELLKQVISLQKELAVLPPSYLTGFVRPDTQGELEGKLRELHAEINGDMVFRVYETCGITLFSLMDGHPILSMHLKTQDSKTTVVFSNDPSCKRILIDKDNQEIRPVVTNLTSYHLHFEISENGSSLNEINVLKPYQQYEIPADRRTGRSMILSSVRISGPSKKKKIKLTVAEDEKKKESERKGLYWKVSVWVESDSPAKWKESNQTVWKCVPFVVYRRPSTDKDVPFEEKQEEDDLSSDSYWNEDSSKEASTTSIWNLPKGGKSRDEEECEKEEEEEEYCDDDEDDSFAGGLFDEEPNMPLPPPILEKVSDLTISSSQVAQMKSGSSVQVNSKNCEIDFNPISCEICSLSLSVQPKLQLLKNQLEYTPSSVTGVVHQDWKEMIQGYLKDKFRDILTSKEYKSEECCVCLTGMPNITFHPCGHRCCHLGCAKSLQMCPFCQQPIRVMLNLS